MTKSHSVFLRTPYNYDVMAASNESGLACEDHSLAIQSSRDECDINTIVENMARGVMPGATSQPAFGDFTCNATDFHDAMNLVITAQEAFDSLPAKVRARFLNDPETLLEFLSDKSNLEEAVKLGLVNPPLEDLSTPAPAAHQGGKAGVGVEKSGGTSKTSPRASKPPLQGVEGDDD